MKMENVRQTPYASSVLENAFTRPMMDGGFSLFDVVVDARRSDARLAGPRIDLRARLARAHVTDARLVPQIAHLGVVAAFRAIL